MTKDLPQQTKNTNTREQILSKMLKDQLNSPDFPDRLKTLIAFDERYGKKGAEDDEKRVNIVDLKEPDTKENLLIADAFRKLPLPDEKHTVATFKYVFEKLKCDPNHLVKLGDVVDEVAIAFFNEPRNVYVNTFLHTLIVNEHRFASGNSLVENVLDLPQIKEHFNFNKRDVIIGGLEKKEKDGKAIYVFGPNRTEKEGKTILCMAAKMREAVIVRKLCELKKEGCNIDLDLPDEHGRTALFYSCVLGDLESTKALLKAGANPNSVDQASIDSCRNNPTEIAIILKSVAIDPERDEKALSNFFVHPQGHQALISDDCKINKRNEGDIGAVIHYLEQTLNSQELSSRDRTQDNAYKECIQFAKMQILDSEGKSFLTGKSLLKSCLEGQVECHDFMSRISLCVKGYELMSRGLGREFPESPPGSVFSPQGNTVAPLPTRPSRAPR